MASEREQHQWHPQAGQDQGQREREGRCSPGQRALTPPMTVLPAPPTTRVSSCSAAPNSQASP
eukprot:104525-Pyramimonas_sp.AAC.1